MGWQSEFRPDGTNCGGFNSSPAFGLAGVNLHTFTGWGSITYWNAFVANLEMHGKGNFSDSRLDDPAKFPVAARNGFGHVTNADDEITANLGPLHFYQLSIPAPAPPKNSFDKQAAARGKVLFSGKAQCSSCHVPPLSDGAWLEHAHCIRCLRLTDFQASRAPDDPLSHHSL